MNETYFEVGRFCWLGEVTISTFSSLAISCISLFPIKEDENGTPGLTAILMRVKYIIVEIFRQIG